MHEMWKEWRCHVYTRWENAELRKECALHIAYVTLLLIMPLGKVWEGANTGGVTNV